VFVSGTGQSNIPLGCITHPASGGMNCDGLFGSIVMTWPPGPIFGAPGGGLPPFSHGS
jgi:hypothetical protein